MKRKTNLFYTTGPDSKFITFSNYTEALTGNYLSVNTKLFPDNFLCLSIKNLNNKTKSLFIKYLVKYYENKLSVLRDNNISNNETIESNIYPLAYLLEAILKVIKISNTNDGYEYELDVNSSNNLNIKDNAYKDINSNEITNLITYIGQISEEDYYGTYTDIICNIDCENFVEGIIKIGDKSNDEITATVDNNNSLYGWENDQILDDYVNEIPIYDQGGNTYTYKSKLSKLVFNKIDNNSTNNKTLKFNIIIPLFSKLNISIENDLNKVYITNNYAERIKTDDTTLSQYIIINENNNGVKHTFDVPLGMWIYADNDSDTFIELIKDNNLNLYPNWSLLISSQFKSFPYSTDYKKLNATSNSSESNSIANSYSTFAEVLTKMNDTLDAFNKMNLSLANMSNRIDVIEKKLSSIGTINNIQKIDEKIVQIESSVNSQINNFKQYMYEYLENIKWNEA